jgi:hypothetical protein
MLQIILFVRTMNYHGEVLKLHMSSKWNRGCAHLTNTEINCTPYILICNFNIKGWLKFV